MKTKIWLSKFDPELEFVALRKLDVAHDDPSKREIMPGARIDKTMFTTRRLRLLYQLRHIGVAGGQEEKQSPAPPFRPYLPENKVRTTVGEVNGSPSPVVQIVQLEPSAASYEVKKKTGQWFVFNGEAVVFGPAPETRCRQKLKELQA